MFYEVSVNNRTRKAINEHTFLSHWEVYQQREETCYNSPCCLTLLLASGLPEANGWSIPTFQKDLPHSHKDDRFNTEVSNEHLLEGAKRSPREFVVRLWTCNSLQQSNICTLTEVLISEWALQKVLWEVAASHLFCNWTELLLIANMSCAKLRSYCTLLS